MVNQSRLITFKLLNPIEMDECKLNLRKGNEPWIEEIIESACELLGNAKIASYEADSKNACAVPVPNGHGYITYDPKFLRELYAINPVYVVIVIAHEVGHIYNWRVNGQNVRNKENELIADRVAGWLTNKWELPLDECLEMFDHYRFRAGGPNHPNGQLRKFAFETGWCTSANCGSVHSIVYKPKPKPVQDNSLAAFLGVGVGLVLLAAIFGKS